MYPIHYHHLIPAPVSKEYRTPSQCIYPISLTPHSHFCPYLPIQKTHLLLRNCDWRLTLLQVLSARVVVHAIVCLVCGVHLLVVLLHGADDFLCDVLEGAVAGGALLRSSRDLESGCHCDFWLVGWLFVLCEARMNRSD